MLQEATRAINSAFNNSFIKKLCQYLHDCVREEVKSSTFRNLKADPDNKWIFLKEVKIGLNESTTSTVLKPVAEEDFICLVMPCRLD